jgi:hypothetical protein
MKAEAIVYESNTGFTRQYANLLSEATMLPAYERKGAMLRKGTDIVYMGWLLAGSVKGYKKAARKYHVKALVGVGMGSPADKSTADVIKKYSTGEMPVFYLQGGFDKTKLRGLYKMMMGNMDNIITKKAQKTEDELRMLEVIKNGKGFVKAENLESIISWIK